MTTRDDLAALTNLEHFRVLVKVLRDRHFQNQIGGEQWSLTEPEEMTLWEIIKELDAETKEAPMRGDTTMRSTPSKTAGTSRTTSGSRKRKPLGESDHER